MIARSRSGFAGPVLEMHRFGSPQAGDDIHMTGISWPRLLVGQGRHECVFSIHNLALSFDTSAKATTMPDMSSPGDENADGSVAHVPWVRLHA